jgi:hypothetical protein
MDTITFLQSVARITGDPNTYIDGFLDGPSATQWSVRWTDLIGQRLAVGVQVSKLVRTNPTDTYARILEEIRPKIEKANRGD